MTEAVLGGPTAELADGGAPTAVSPGGAPAGTAYVSREFGVRTRHRWSPVGLAFDDLVQLALRRNPRRAQLLVSTVLGKHLPADPLLVAGMGRLLGALVRLRLDAGPDGSAAPPPAMWAVAARAAVAGSADRTTTLSALMLALAPPAGTAPYPAGLLTLGFAETATSVGHLVAEQLGSPYLHSTRRTDGDAAVAAEFSEPHSHATGHLLRPSDPALLDGSGPLVLVDDELSTGRTALNVIEALHARRPRPWYLLAGLVDVRSPESDEMRIATARRLGCRIDVVSLCTGRVEVPDGTVDRVAARFTATPAARVPRHQAGPVSSLPLTWPTGIPMGGRHGITPDDTIAFDAAVRRATSAVDAALADLPGDPSLARRVLVLGTEELMYLPLRVAMDLVGLGHQVRFQSTTRSPVHALDEPGYPIRRRIDFRRRPDDGGDAPVDRLVYNAVFPSGPALTAGDAPVDEADVVVVVDDGYETPVPDGLSRSLARATGRPVLAVTLQGGAA